MLPMGFSWPVIWHRTLINQLHRSGSTLNPHLKTDPGSPWILKRDLDSSASYVYVVNVGFLSDQNVIIKTVIDNTATYFNKIGINLNEIMVYAEGGLVLGVYLDGRGSRRGTQAFREIADVECLGLGHLSRSLLVTPRSTASFPGKSY